MPRCHDRSFLAIFDERTSAETQKRNNQEGMLSHTIHTHRTCMGVARRRETQYIPLTIKKAISSSIALTGIESTAFQLMARKATQERSRLVRRVLSVPAC